MLLECVNELNAEQVVSEDLIIELFGIDDAFVHETTRQEIEDRAAELKIKGRFTKAYNAYKKEAKKTALMETD